MTNVTFRKLRDGNIFIVDGKQRVKTAQKLSNEKGEILNIKAKNIEFPHEEVLIQIKPTK